MYATLDFLKKIFPLKQCKTPKFKDRPCLYYQIGRCMAPCQGLVSSEEYKNLVKQAELFLSGKQSELIKQIEEEMQDSCNAAYEDLCLTSLEILHPDEGKNFCCFCDAVFDGDGNSTWPIYYKQDGEKCRCCDACNEKYVTAARRDYTLIMGFRKQFGIDYAE